MRPSAFFKGGLENPGAFALNHSRRSSGSSSQFGSMLFLGFQVWSAILVLNSSIICKWFQNKKDPEKKSLRINKPTLNKRKPTNMRRGSIRWLLKVQSHYFVFHSSVRSVWPCFPSSLFSSCSHPPVRKKSSSFSISTISESVCFNLYLDAPH